MTELPEGWSEVALDEVAEVSAGNPAPKDVVPFGEDGLPFVRVRDLGALDGAVITETRDAVPPEVGEKLRRFPAGTILFTKSGMSTLLNQRAILGREMHIVSHIGTLIPKESVSSRWLYYWLKQVDFADLVHATTLPSLQLKKVRALKAPLVSQQLQETIVEAIDTQFTRLDAAEQALERAQANLERYRASVLKAAVEGRLVPTEAELARQEGRDYEPASDLLERILTERRHRWEQAELAKMKAKGKELKNDNWKRKYKPPQPPDTDNLPELPEGWCWATVGQLSYEVRYGSSVKTSRDDADAVPVLRMGNMTHGRIDFHDLKYLPSDHDEFPDLLLKEGDLLFNRTNSAELVGKVAVFHGYLTACSFASYLIRVRHLPGVSPDFVAAYINSWHGRMWIRSVISQQVGQANVNGTKLKACALPLPPTAEQERIMAEVDQAESVALQMEAEIESAIAKSFGLRQSILKWAFEGKLVDQGITCA